MFVYIIVLDQQDDPSEIEAVYADEMKANAECFKLNEQNKNCFAEYVVQKYEIKF